MKMLLMIFGFTILISCKKTDNRDKIVGKYKCNNEHYTWQMGDTSIIIIKEIDTLVVSKKGKTDIEIFHQNELIQKSIKLDPNWSYQWSEPMSNKISIQFFPDKDSISYYLSYGGIGGYYSTKFTGTKIKSE